MKGSVDGYEIFLCNTYADPDIRGWDADDIGRDCRKCRYKCQLYQKGDRSTEKKRIIESKRGVSGFQLAIPPKKLLLFDVYEAVSESDQVHVFDLHQNPNDKCIVGKHIRPVLSDVFRSVEEKAERELRKTTLADCIDRMRKQIASCLCTSDKKVASGGSKGKTILKIS